MLQDVILLCSKQKIKITAISLTNNFRIMKMTTLFTFMYIIVLSPSKCCLKYQIYPQSHKAKIPSLKAAGRDAKGTENFNYTKKLFTKCQTLEDKQSNLNNTKYYYQSFSRPNVCFARLQMELCLAANIFTAR